MMMMSCLSVCNVGRPYCGQTVAYFSYCSAELLFIDPGVHMWDSFCLFCFCLTRQDPKGKVGGAKKFSRRN